MNPSFTTLAQLAHGLEIPVCRFFLGQDETRSPVSPPGHNTSDTPIRHGGDEFGIILSGRKDVYLDGECHTLEAGDSITYSSNFPHWGPDYPSWWMPAAKSARSAWMNCCLCPGCMQPKTTGIWNHRNRTTAKH